MKIILASSSPRRKRLLEKLGIDFESISPDINEEVHEDESPYEFVHRMSIEKSLKVANDIHESAIVIGGDVTIDLDGTSLGKVSNRDEAFTILEQLSDRSHYIRDGFAIIVNKELFTSGVVTSEVTFNKLTDEIINEYLDHDKWQDKAGGYGLQHEANMMVKKIYGSYFNIVGLPIVQIASELINLGIEIDPDRIEGILEEDNMMKVERGLK